MATDNRLACPRLAYCLSILPRAIPYTVSWASFQKSGRSALLIPVRSRFNAWSPSVLHSTSQQTFIYRQFVSGDVSLCFRQSDLFGKDPTKHNDSRKLSHDRQHSSYIVSESAAPSISAKTQSQKKKQPPKNFPPKLSGSEVRQKFLNFYASKKHLMLPSASLVPEDPTVLLTIAGMLPFKPIFLGQQAPQGKRVTTSQKCIRTNDIENVGRTKRHHTFFEMLGNFSFGDYFKREAIGFAWELVTKEFGIPPERLAISVFRDDDEAFNIWRDEIGVPEDRLVRLGEADNFWASGATGPCGPCSEIYYDFHPESKEPVNLEDDSRFIEFYNLVFMQYNRLVPDGELVPLQNKNIDTGMGLERMAQILQQVPNNYETDLIFPIIQEAAILAGRPYSEADEATKVSLKVIGDHVRAVTHMIADGITASNMGRGYILRRLIRRIIRHGRVIGIPTDTPFTPLIADVAISLAANVYPHVPESADKIKDELAREESRFMQTLERGEKVLEDILARLAVSKSKEITGKDAFILYDTYGYPLELTQEIAEEQGLAVDVKGFEVEMEKARQLSQDAHEAVDVVALGELDAMVKDQPPTDFIGYTDLAGDATVTALIVNGKSSTTAPVGSEVHVVLDRTPFYAESGGQIGDKGYLVVSASSDPNKDVVVLVTGVDKRNDTFVHRGKVERGSLSVGDHVHATIDEDCRRGAMAHHTATHLLQSALKSVVDKGVSQAGSLVAFDRLRFDFNCSKPVTSQQLQKIEELINSWISESHPTSTVVMPLAEAKSKGAVAMFGEKYGEVVRVVEVPGVSMELCGGTHVANTRDIGVFKIRSEGGIASGVRRIEALAGDAARLFLFQQEQIVRDLCSDLKARPEELGDRISTLQTDLKTTQKQLADAKAQLAIAKAELLVSNAHVIGDCKVLVEIVDGAVEADALKAAAEGLMKRLGDPAAVVLGSAMASDKVSLVAAFSPEAVKKGLNAGKLVGAAAKVCGGGGGGKPNFAQAGGKDSARLQDALDDVVKSIKEALS